MSMETHVNALTTKHATLDEIIHEEMHRPSPDHVKISELKRQKLRIKEQILQTH
jgi:hypothetical protein